MSPPKQDAADEIYDGRNALARQQEAQEASGGPLLKIFNGLEEDFIHIPA
jgi:hypothetical protein